MPNKATSSAERLLERRSVLLRAWQFADPPALGSLSAGRVPYLNSDGGDDRAGSMCQDGRCVR